LRKRIFVIDDDLGQSAQSADTRHGFQRLQTEVALDHVGLILGWEMSRLARSCKDWCHLLEVCALSETLLADQDGLYDPTENHDAPHRVTVGIPVGAVRAHGLEADAPCLDPLLVVAGGGDDHFMSSGLQTRGEGDVGMQVAQGAERREDDPPPGVTRASTVCRSG
jgi:hypothetical protein